MNTSKIDRYRSWLLFKNKLKVNQKITLFIRMIKFKILKPIVSIGYCVVRMIVWNLKRNEILKLTENDKKLSKLYNQHKGETAFIIGNGPSLKAEDLDYVFENHFYSFGSNRINMIFDETQWRPNAYCAIDRRLMFNDDTTLSEINEEDKIELFIYSKKLYDCLPFKLLKNETVYVYEKPTNFYYKEKEFGVEPRLYFTDGYTVTNLALQMAVFMGFKRICLLGIDCSYSNEVDVNGFVKHHEGIKNYFKNRTEKDNDNIAFVSGMMQAYEIAKKFADNNGIEIYNCSANSPMSIFQSKDIREIM